MNNYKKLSTNEMIAFYCDDGETFYCGNYVKSDDCFLLIQSYSKYGRYDGFILKRIESVRKIEQYSKYLSSIDKLAKTMCIQPKKKIVVDESVLYDSILFCIENDILVSIECEGSDELITGKIISCIDNVIKFELFNEYGEYDGIAEFSPDLIESMFIDGEDEKKIQMLSK